MSKREERYSRHNRMQHAATASRLVPNRAYKYLPFDVMRVSDTAGALQDPCQSMTEDLLLI